MAYDWAPTPQQVATYVPWLTIDPTVPGSQTYLDTFTANTVPSATAAGLHIIDATNTVGVFLSDPLAVAIKPLATVAAALLAAYTLAIAYPRDPENDASRIAALLALYQAALKTLTDAAEDAGQSPASAIPVWYSPDPVPWGDALL